MVEHKVVASQEDRSAEPHVELVRSAARALNIIELLVDFPRGLSLTDIGNKLNIPLSSLHSLMGTLVYEGYLVKDEASSLYSVSSKLVQLATKYYSQYDLVSLADPIMKRLVRVASEMTSLAVLQNSSVVIVHKRASQDVIQVVNPVGSQLPAHSSSLGKVILAHLESEEVDRLFPHEDLPTFTPHTISTRTELKKVLEEIRQRGYAFDDEETTEGVWAVAAAICDRHARPVAALSIAAPLFRVQDEEVSDWCDAVVEGAEQISASLGFAQ